MAFTNEPSAYCASER